MKGLIEKRPIKQSAHEWERESGMKATWFLNRDPMSVLSLERFDLPSNHIRPPCLDWGVSMLQGVIGNHMAGISIKYSARQVIDMVKRPNTLTPKQISYLRELINHCSPRILKLVSISVGLTIYELAHIMGICGINNRRLVEWINSYVPDYQVSFYWKRMW